MLNVDDSATRRGVPLLRVETEGYVSLEESEEYFGYMSRRGFGDLGIWNCTAARVPPMEVLRRWGRWMEANREAISSNPFGLIFIVPNAAVRGALKFCFALAPSSAQVRVVRTLEQADAMARRILEEHGAASAAELDRVFAAQAS